jgi:hypothetical protein
VTANLQAAATPGTTVTAALSGTVLAPAKLSSNTASFAFPGVAAGASTAGQTFTFSNAAGAQTTGTIAIALTGADAALFTITANGCNGITLAGAATCTVTVSFTPAGGTAPGLKSATLQASATPGGSAGTALGGQVLAPAALSISPSAQDFGAVTMGSSTSPITFTVTNTGGLATAALQVTMNGTNFGDFVVSSDNCTGKTVSAGATCTFVVTFSPPAGGAAGGRSATATVTDGSATTSSSLTGTAQ